MLAQCSLVAAAGHSLERRSSWLVLPNLVHSAHVRAHGRRAFGAGTRLGHHAGVEPKRSTCFGAGHGPRDAGGHLRHVAVPPLVRRAVRRTIVATRMGPGTFPELRGQRCPPGRTQNQRRFALHGNRCHDAGWSRSPQAAPAAEQSGLVVQYQQTRQYLEPFMLLCQLVAPLQALQRLWYPSPEAASTISLPGGFDCPS